MDLSDRKTVASVQRWKEDLDSKVKNLLVSFPSLSYSKVELPDGRPIPALLLANKSDLNKKREVRTEQVFLLSSNLLSSLTLASL